MNIFKEFTVADICVNLYLCMSFYVAQTVVEVANTESVQKSF